MSVDAPAGLGADAGSIPAASIHHTERKDERMGASKKGQYYRPHPLDFELLKRMPREGSTLGYHTLAMTVAHVKSALNKEAPEGGKLTAEQISSRLASMKYAGLVVTAPVLGHGGKGVGWQRTLKGENHYEQQTGESLGDAAPELRVVEGGSQ